MPQLVKAYLEFRSNSEPRPAEPGFYLVAFEDSGTCYTGEGYWDGRSWMETDTRSPKPNVYAWTHMPEAPAPWVMR